MCTGSHIILYTVPISQNMKKKMTTKQNTLRPLIRAKVYLNISKLFLATTVVKTHIKMSRDMRESAFYVCENIGPDHLSGSRTANQRLSFCYIDNTHTLLYESEILKLRPSALSVSVTWNTSFLATRLNMFDFLTSKRPDDCLCCGLCQFYQTEAVGIRHLA